MFSDFIRRRPLLRALFALLLFAGLLGTAAATHAHLTAGHSMAAAVDSVGADVDTSALDDTASVEDNAYDDTLDVPAVPTMLCALLAEACPATTHAAPGQWHASSALRPPIV